MRSRSPKRSRSHHQGSLEIARSHISGTVSWPPNESLRRHYSYFLNFIREATDEGRLLDVGCGDGSLARMLAESSSDLEVLGIDVAPHDLWNIPKPGNLEFAVASIEELPFEEESVDFVLLKDVLHHIPAPSATLEKIRNVAKKRVLVIEANRYNPLSYIWMVKIAGHDHFSRKKLRGILSADADTVLHTAETHVWPPSLDRIGRLLEALMNRFRFLGPITNYNFATIEVGRPSRASN
ncbi:MAG: class I SAM-dependent methyltransferase [Actinobacteria bacterium]|nr:class I SAM-dependent methyltransferase [Actinomycetota bacterium]